MRAVVALLLAVGCAHRPTRAELGGRDPDEITSVALGADAAYATTVLGGVVLWNMRSPGVGALRAPGFAILAADGSVSVNVTHGGSRGDELEVWDLQTEQLLRSASFGEGIDEIGAVSRAVVLMRLNYRYDHVFMTGVPAVLPPRSHAVAWDVASGRVDEQPALSGCDEHTALTADGRVVLCVSSWGGTSWIDRQTGRLAGAEQLAPEWWPPEPPPEAGPFFKGRPRDPDPPPFILLSARLSPTGDAAYVAYRGVDEHRTWRLERWRPADGRAWERLASTDGDDFTEVLAASADGALVVLGGRRKPLTVRRAPGYAPEPLAATSANAAAVSRDGARILSGHEDGRLMLWDARSLALLASASVAGAARTAGWR